MECICIQDLVKHRQRCRYLIEGACTKEPNINDERLPCYGTPPLSEIEIHVTKKEPEKDPKSRYYDQGGLETLDIIKAKLTEEQYKGFLLGNCIKYSCRANWKEDFKRDVEKFTFYATELFNLL